MTGDLTSRAGRAKRRPPGASVFTQGLYRLLHEHPEGLTRADIHEALREGWMETDAYRAYASYLNAKSKVYQQGPTASRLHRSGRLSTEPGTPEFKERAQRWWISKRLGAMRDNGSIKCEGTGEAARWFAVRGPQVQGQRSTYVEFDPEESRAILTTTTADHANRENAKAELLARLNDHSRRGPKPVDREAMQAAYDWLCGRR